MVDVRVSRSDFPGNIKWFSNGNARWSVDGESRYQRSDEREETAKIVSFFFIQIKDTLRKCNMPYKPGEH